MVDLVEINVVLRRGGHGAALKPTDADGAAPVVGGMVEGQFAGDRGDVGIEFFAFRFGGGGQGGVDGVPEQVHGVAAHVADLAGAEVPVHVPR